MTESSTWGEPEKKPETSLWKFDSKTQSGKKESKGGITVTTS